MWLCGSGESHYGLSVGGKWSHALWSFTAGGASTSISTVFNWRLPFGRRWMFTWGNTFGTCSITFYSKWHRTKPVPIHRENSEQRTPKTYHLTTCSLHTASCILQLTA
jgi:hypothetical protein